MTRDDLELYVMGAYDGDAAALEAELATDAAARAIVAEEAALELLLRDAAAAATFCPACDDIVRPNGDARCATCGAATAAGGYTIERVLVHNAHGRMYVARDADGAEVALKELAFVQAPNADAHAAFEREARMLRALEHPAIPRFVAAFEEGSGVHARYYLAQELVAGQALDRKLVAHWFTEAECIELARQVLRVLVYLQTLSPMVVHRDIKPANLIARDDGSITVVDFGAAHVGGATIGSTSIGTFGYMPVEQMAGIVDATTDTYALGASLLHLLTRREPWKLLQAPAWDDVNVSPAMRAYLRKLVAAEPRDRFASAQAALDALDNLGKGKPVITRTAIRIPRILLAAAAVLTIGGIGFGSYRAGLRHASHDGATTSSPLATVRLNMAPGIAGEMSVDGKRVGTVMDKQEIPLVPGEHRIVIEGAHGMKCEETVTLDAGKTATLVCDAPPALSWEHDQYSVPRLSPGPNVDLDYNESPGADVLRSLSVKCGLNLILPDNIDFRVTAQTKQVPCDQAFEVVLENQGLWYWYMADIHVVRIAPRKQLDAELEAQALRLKTQRKLGETEVAMPGGPPVDIDLAKAPLRALIEMLASRGGVNVIIPDGIDARVTVRANGVPWQRLLDPVLRSQGLGYRYRPNGKLLRIAPQKQLDAEDEAEVARRHL